ncbi:hypothetical protein Ancab_017830 [Ancistrocladus abbreviatus]
MLELIRSAEELAAALAAGKGPPAQTDIEVGQYAPAIAGGAFAQPRPTGTALLPLPLGGGPCLQLDDEEMMRLQAEKGGQAGGWRPELSRTRAFEEAFGSLLI